MKIVVSQLNPTIGDLKGNTLKIIHSIEHAKKLQADLIVFPELIICGYPPEDLLLHEALIDEMQRCLETITMKTKGIAALVGLARRHLFQGEKDLFNSVAVLEDGHLLGYHDKWLLPTYDVFSEKRYFEPGKELKIWNIKGKKIGITICEDIWKHAGYVDLSDYEKDPIEELSKLSPDILINISASPFEYMKPDMRVKVAIKASKTLKCPVILCCQVGANDQIIYDGYSVYVDRLAKLCQLAQGFKEEEMLVDTSSSMCEARLNYDPIHDLYEALSLGLKDYMHKSGFHKVCLGLSGGVDSALVAEIAVHALGKENVLAVSMPSKYTSDASIEDAKKLASNLDIRLITIPIEPIVKSYHEQLHSAFLGKPEDLTEENLQARIRGVILMALSNKHGYIVLSTGNKSEIAMGFCTLYGDMCGGLSVIGDVTKRKVYELCRYINSQAGYDKIPENILIKEPSAELRQNQKDTDTLPDYATVDQVLEGYVENYLRPEQIADKFQLPLDLVQSLIRKIHFSEYKRRQGPPTLKVSKKSFGIGRQYPIVQKWVTSHIE